MDAETKLYSIGVVGSRHFTSDFYDILAYCLKHRINQIGKPVQIVSGGAEGADTLAECFANANLLPSLILRPDWDKYGKRAGFVRNMDIINASDEIFALWDGESKGTEHTIVNALDMNKDVDILLFADNSLHYAHLHLHIATSGQDEHTGLVDINYRHFLVPNTGEFETQVLSTCIPYKCGIFPFKERIMESYNSIKTSRK